MLKRRYTKTEAVGVLSIIFALGMLYDFHQRGFQLLNVFVPIGMMAFGQGLRKRENSIFGNVLFIMGALGLSFTLFSMIAIWWVIIALIIYMGYQLLWGGPALETAVTLKPHLSEKEFIRTDPMFKSFLVGQLQSPDTIYELDDINIQFGFGDIVLDFSNTLIPEGETVIIIRGMVGKIQLAVPYDIELSVQTSTLVGRLHILDNSDRFFNTTQKYMTKDYGQGNRKMRIVASTLVGDIEVRNI